MFADSKIAGRILLIALVMQSTLLLGQKTIKVKDPEIEFSFVKPNSWKTGDDGYHYMIFPPDKFDAAALGITYFEHSDSANIDNIYDVDVKYMLPRNELNFSMISQGDEFIGSIKAKWIQYLSTAKGHRYESIYYMFNENGQTFKIVGTARKENFADYKDDFIKIIRSIKSTKI